MGKGWHWRSHSESQTEQRSSQGETKRKSHCKLGGTTRSQAACGVAQGAALEPNCLRFASSTGPETATKTTATTTTATAMATLSAATTMMKFSLSK